MDKTRQCSRVRVGGVNKALEYQGRDTDMMRQISIHENDEVSSRMFDSMDIRSACQVTSQWSQHSTSLVSKYICKVHYS